MFQENTPYWICREIGKLEGKLELSNKAEEINGGPLIARKKREEMQGKIDDLYAQLKTHARVRDRSRAVA